MDPSYPHPRVRRVRPPVPAPRRSRSPPGGPRGGAAGSPSEALLPTLSSVACLWKREPPTHLSPCVALRRVGQDGETRGQGVSRAASSALARGAGHCHRRGQRVARPPAPRLTHSHRRGPRPRAERHHLLPGPGRGPKAQEGFSVARAAGTEKVPFQEVRKPWQGRGSPGPFMYLLSFTSSGLAAWF